MSSTLSISMSATMSKHMKAFFLSFFCRPSCWQPCRPSCRPLCLSPCRPPCQPQQCYLNALGGLREAVRMEIRKYVEVTDGLTGVSERDACASKNWCLIHILQISACPASVGLFKSLVPSQSTRPLTINSSPQSTRPQQSTRPPLSTGPLTYCKIFPSN